MKWSRRLECFRELTPTQAAAGTNSGARLPAAVLRPHPSEDQIVSEATAERKGELLQELKGTEPDLVVTLGDAALRVFRQMLGGPDGVPGTLAADDSYGVEHAVRVGERNVRWLPLAHPAAPSAYRDAHAKWCQRRGAGYEAVPEVEE